MPPLESQQTSSINTSELQEAGKTAETIKNLLIALLEKKGESSHAQDEDAIRECESLGLIRKTGALLNLTVLGRRMARYERNRKSEEDRNILDEKKEGEISGHELNNLLLRVKGTVLGHVIDRRILRKDDNLSDLLGIPDFNGKGAVGRYIGTLPVRRQIPAINAIRPFMLGLHTIHNAFSRRTTNKVAIDCRNGTSVSGKGLHELIRLGLERYGEISSGAHQKEYEFVPLDIVGDLDFEGYDNSAEDLLFLSLRYILTGVGHPSMAKKPFRNSGNTTKKTLEEQIRGLGIPGKKSSGSRKVVYTFSAERGSKESFATICKILKTRSCNHMDQSFGTRLEAQPMIYFGEGAFENDYDGLRQVQFLGSQTPRFMEEAMGIDSKKRESMSQNRFIYEILRTKGVKVVGVQNLRHVVETMEHDGRWKEKRNLLDILYFILEKTEEITEEAMIQILEICSKNGIREIPPFLVQLCIRRFHINASLFERYQLVQQNYEPQIFMDNLQAPATSVKSTHAVAMKPESEDLGLDPEVDSMIQGLGETGSVLVVDTTRYNSGGGDYDAIPERLFGRLTQRIMAGSVPDSLKNHSVVEIGIEEKNGWKALLSLLQGGDPGTIIDDITKIHEGLLAIANYNPDTVIVLRLPTQYVDAQKIGEFLEIVGRLGLKIVISGPQSIPGVENLVQISAFSDQEIRSRLCNCRDEMSTSLGVIIPETIIMRIVSIVARMRNPGTDPLHLSIRIIQACAINSHACGRREINGEDLGFAVSTFLDMTNTQQMEGLQKSLQALPGILNEHIVGQAHVINTFCARVESHILGGSNPDRPLSFLFPGPTGVGKTWMAEVLHKHFNIPLLTLDGSMYKEAHSVARLTGSPPGYVNSNEGGTLTNFMRDNELGIVFIDELDKMHPEVRMAIMNFVDEGKMTSGVGKTFQRKRYIIIAATNAGAEKLHAGMDKSQIVDCIAEAFQDDKGVKKPEFANRFNILPMLGVSKEEFRRAVRQNLMLIGMRPMMINFEIEITGIDDDVVDFIYGICESVCRTHNASDNVIRGFGQGTKPPLSADFFNLREINRAIDASIAQYMVSISRNRGVKGGKYRIKKVGSEIQLAEDTPT